jgi:hypothetical protein
MRGLKNISPQQLSILGGAPKFQTTFNGYVMALSSSSLPKNRLKKSCPLNMCGLVSCRWRLLNKCFKKSFFCLPHSQNVHIFSKSHIWQFHVCDDQCWVVLTFSVRTFKVFNPVLILRIGSFQIKWYFFENLSIGSLSSEQTFWKPQRVSVESFLINFKDIKTYGHRFSGCLVEFSVNSGKQGTSTLSLVQNRVRLKKTLQNSTLAFNGESNSEMRFLCQTEFPQVLTGLSFFMSASTVAKYIFTAPTSTTTIITSNLVH